MAQQPTTKPTPLDKEDLGEFLLWLFNQPGHQQLVDQWRATLRTPARPSPTPPQPNR
jgi:hypothetical protein